jgi:hypothetical protein
MEFVDLGLEHADVALIDGRPPPPVGGVPEPDFAKLQFPHEWS